MKRDEGRHTKHSCLANDFCIGERTPTRGSWHRYATRVVCICAIDGSRASRSHRTTPPVPRSSNGAHWRPQVLHGAALPGQRTRLFESLFLFFICYYVFSSCVCLFSFFFQYVSFLSFLFCLLRIHSFPFPMPYPSPRQHAVPG